MVFKPWMDMEIKSLPLKRWVCGVHVSHDGDDKADIYKQRWRSYDRVTWGLETPLQRLQIKQVRM